MCCEYNRELFAYRDKLISLGITDDMFEACHPSADNRRIPEEERTKEAREAKAKQYLATYSGSDKDYLIRFLWDYDSWGGGKNIKRANDFAESPVLNIANSINASSSLIGTLAKALSERLDCLELLHKSDGWNVFYKQGTPSARTYSCPRVNQTYRPYITAIKSKPFLLLAGISGTGKSRIVRELARACWDADSEEFNSQKPRNFEMVQVKPNWHDSSELIGYVSRVSGEPVYVAGDFLKFVAKAWEEPNVPYFLCLDEMNLAPVEQYFAEYLSVVESRKADEEGNISTDPLLKSVSSEWYWNLCRELTSEEELREQFRDEGVSIPQNLIVVGTVNMDETTFSFSRKVLDRAMTIEMNEVNLKGGLTERYEQIGKLGEAELIGSAVEGVDVYKTYHTVCDKVIEDLDTINKELNGTPFKIAYRTRNEFLLYVVNNLPYKTEGETDDYVIKRALDEIISMKILSRIEGDADRIGNLLERLIKVIKELLGESFSEDNSISLKKLAEMENRLKSGYTSFWS
ncbi:MAG: AAA family ATPase [Prevotella sp.]|nr:AAA family ATPase [Prevotella sp.]